MPKQWPRMRPLRPRGRPRKNAPSTLTLTAQQLRDLKHRMSSEVESLLVLAEQGNQELLHNRRLKLKSDLLKYGPEMEKIASKINIRAVRAVRTFLDSVDEIVHAEAFWLDREKQNAFINASKSLESFLLAA